MALKDFVLGIDKKNKNAYQVGDALLVRYESTGGKWKVRRFVGICISITRKGTDIRYTLRNVIKGTSIEFSFYLYSPMVLSVDKIPVQKFNKVRKSKLLNLRKQRLGKSTLKIA